MKRIPELDALRGLAALAIVAYHVWLIEHAALGTAVDLFFVLSGYLITTIILKESATPRFLTTFYARRALRIWPIYYITLAALVLLNGRLADPGPLDALPYYLTYTQRLPLYWSDAEPAFLPAFRHTWTLAIEEQFYLIWPALVLAVGRRRLAPLCLGLVVLATAARATGFAPWLLLARCDGLALGGMLAALRLRDQGAPGRLDAGPATAVAGSVVLLVALKAGGEALMPASLAGSLQLTLLNVAYFGVVGLVVRHAGAPALGVLRGRWLCGLGQISYGLYLYHHVILSAVRGAAGRVGIEGGGWLGGVEVALSLGLAVLSWRLVERPLLRLKDRFAYRAAPAAAAVGTRIGPAALEGGRP